MKSHLVSSFIPASTVTLGSFLPAALGARLGAQAPPGSGRQPQAARAPPGQAAAVGVDVLKVGTPTPAMRPHDAGHWPQPFDVNATGRNLS